MTRQGSRGERRFLPYGRQSIDPDDLRAVNEVLTSDWLTTGPKVDEFEAAVAAAAGTRHAVALANGTAALHAAAFALGIGPGDEVIVPALTFAATANAVVYQGGTPVFADVDPETLLVDPEDVGRKITPKTRAIFGVDYGGQPCDYDRLRALAAEHAAGSGHEIVVAADACHALGGSDRGRPVGSLATLSTFSFHPVKPITTAEGGMVTTDDDILAGRLRLFRNHGITTDHRQRAESGSWFYEMVELGYNYRLSDLHCALGISQLRKLRRYTERRRALAARYRQRLPEVPGAVPLHDREDAENAYHLFVVRLVDAKHRRHKDEIFQVLRQRGVGVNVHYVPVHLHPFYRRRFGHGPGLCPRAEAAYEEIFSLPIFPGMEDEDVDFVVETLAETLASIPASGASTGAPRGAADAP